MQLKSKLKEAIRQLTTELYGSIATAIANCPEKSYKQIALEHCCSEATVLKAAARHGLSRTSGPKPKCGNHEKVADEASAERGSDVDQ
jgi:hypothetical protein